MKTFSKLLYAAYSLFVVLILVFGNDIVPVAIDSVKAQLTEKKEITDVDVHLEERELLAGRYYYPEYIPIGDFDGDAGLVYTSLDPEHLVVSGTGAICAKNNFEGESIEASVKVTSKYDKDFEKIITYRFVKKYPTEFNVRYFIKGHSFDTETLYVGVPVYVYSNVLSSNPPYNCTDYELVCNEDYFEREEDGALIPKRVTTSGETLNFIVMYGNGATAISKSFEIKEPEYQVAEVDEIKINNLVGDVIENVRGTPLVITLFKQGELVATDYSLKVEDESDVSMSLSGNYYFKTAGDKSLTITLPSGYSKTFLIKVRNVFGSFTLEDTELDKSRYISMLDTETKVFKYSFEKGVTYTKVNCEYDEEIISVHPGSTSCTITPKKEGVTTLTLIVDDGISRIEEKFTVEVKENTSIRDTIIKSIGLWLPKIFGHGGLFAVLALFSMFMFNYVEIDNIFARFGLYMLSGLSVALISEFIQIFIPLRTGSVGDVAIDMCGFIFGTLFALLCRAIKVK